MNHLTKEDLNRSLTGMQMEVTALRVEMDMRLNVFDNKIDSLNNNIENNFYKTDRQFILLQKTIHSSSKKIILYTGILMIGALIAVKMLAYFL